MSEELEGESIVPRGLSKYRFRIHEHTVTLERKKRMHHFTRGYSDVGPWFMVCEISKKDFYAMLDGLDYLQRETDRNDCNVQPDTDRPNGGEA